jgi:hypothetical protein
MLFAQLTRRRRSKSLWSMDALESDRRIDHFVLPCRGYAIAAYAVPDHRSRRFVAYAKVCREVPADYWEVEQCFAKFASEGEHDVPAAAIEDAIEVAVMSLANSGYGRL